MTLSFFSGQRRRLRVHLGDGSPLAQESPRRRRRLLRDRPQPELGLQVLPREPAQPVQRRVPRFRTLRGRLLFFLLRSWKSRDLTSPGMLPEIFLTPRRRNWQPSRHSSRRRRTTSSRSSTSTATGKCVRSSFHPSRTPPHPARPSHLAPHPPQSCFPGRIRARNRLPTMRTCSKPSLARRRRFATSTAARSTLAA